MTTSPYAFSPYDHVPEADDGARKTNLLSTPLWLTHTILFTAMMFCVVLPDILEASGPILIVRQVAYFGYTFLMLVISLFSPVRMTKTESLYLALTAGVAMLTMGTALTMPQARMVDYLGPCSFLLGVYVSALVLPRLFRGSADSIVLVTMFIVTIAVFVGFFLRLGGNLKHDNTVAAYAGLTILLLALRGLRREATTPSRVLYWSGAVGLFFILATSMGRTSMGACLGAGYVLTWCGSMARRKALLLFALLVLGVGLFLTDTGATLMDTLLSKGQTWQRRQQTLATLSGRVDIWETGLHESGVSWLGHGPLWISEVTGKTAHSSYFSAYFAYGLPAFGLWMAMCSISAWLAIKCARRERKRGTFPLGPALVIYYLVISLAEAFFSLLVGGFGMLFYIGTGMCIWSLRTSASAAEASEVQA